MFPQLSVATHTRVMIESARQAPTVIPSLNVRVTKSPSGSVAVADPTAEVSCDVPHSIVISGAQVKIGGEFVPQSSITSQLIDGPQIEAMFELIPALGANAPLSIVYSPLSVKL